jgi:hypothetical protein
MDPPKLATVEEKEVAQVVAKEEAAEASQHTLVDRWSGEPLRPQHHKQLDLTQNLQQRAKSLQEIEGEHQRFVKALEEQHEKMQEQREKTREAEMAAIAHSSLQGEQTGPSSEPGGEQGESQSVQVASAEPIASDSVIAEAAAASTLPVEPAGQDPTAAGKFLSVAHSMNKRTKAPHDRKRMQ